MSGCDKAAVKYQPRQFNDHGSSFIFGDLAQWLEDRELGHVRSTLYCPQSKVEIERWHQTLKYHLLLADAYLVSNLENKVNKIVDYYNNHRYHESIRNVTELYPKVSDGVIRLHLEVARSRH